jgi:hypothetical protein
MEEFLNLHADVPEDDLNAFVLARKIIVPEFLFIISSKKLLENIKYVESHWVSDGTYKLIHEKYPVLVMGTTDRSKQFHTFAVAVSSNERTQEFDFMFSSLQEQAESLFGVDFHPKKLVSDASDAIRNGFLTAYPEREIDDTATCYFHMRQAVTKKVSILFLIKTFLISIRFKN